jgi:hypothetical protein
LGEGEGEAGTCGWGVRDVEGFLVVSFFDFIPARMAFNKALDDVASCLCSISSEKLSATYEYQRDIYESYIRVLALLRRCIEDPDKKMESETLCASIFLQMCEVRPALFQMPHENSS